MEEKRILPNRVNNEGQKKLSEIRQREVGMPPGKSARGEGP